MTLPEELRDRPAHRISDGDGGIDLERVEQRSGVVRAIFEPERTPAADSASMSPLIGCDDPEMLAE